MAQRICPVCGLKTGDASCPECNNATIIERRDEIEVQSLAGKVFNKKYRIEELLGKGGMGSVYRGVNVNVNQKVAVKVMHRELIESQDQVRRFCNEARLSCMLAHPNTLNVYDFGESDEGFLFIVMEYLKGKPLSKVIKEESPLAAGRVLNMAISVARSLAEAHEKGIVHRDLKPENIMLLDFVGQKDFVKVLDFGIAKIVSGGSGESSITKTGMLIGTPKYMSPEQIKSLPLDGRSDIYSLGVIMYQALTGNLPFTGDTPVSVLMSHVNEDVPPFPENLMIGKPLQEIVFRLLEKEREKRPHAWELIGMLERELDRIRPLLNYEQESETAQNRTMKLRGEDGAGMPGGKIFKAIAAIMLVATAGFLFQHYFRSEDKKTIEGTPPAAIKESDASIYEKDTAGVETP
ncbi:MAG: serine/threonine protein kinase, partial [Deltaproteobacteria bacterium]|nr:serine/threonine protein kinase [Deltaproteobacteria bacterium]